MSQKRAARRLLARQEAKLARARERLADLDPGGAPHRPLEVESASEVEPRARSMPCPKCEGELRVEEHAAATIDSVRLRIARMVCARCGSRRSIYFRLGSPLPS